MKCHRINDKKEEKKKEKKREDGVKTWRSTYPWTETLEKKVYTMYTHIYVYAFTRICAFRNHTMNGSDIQESRGRHNRIKGYRTTTRGNMELARDRYPLKRTASKDFPL